MYGQTCLTQILQMFTLRTGLHNTSSEESLVSKSILHGKCIKCGFRFQGDCWICMELMSISLDKFYKFTSNHMAQSIPEDILGKITVAVSV